MRACLSRGAWAATLVAVCAVWGGPPAIAQDVPPEYQLKAAFLYHFPQFVDWPPRVLAPDRPVSICVLSPNPFGRVLDEMADGASIASHPLVVRSVEATGRVDSCQVLFLSGKAPGRDLVLKRVSGLPVLTVSDDDHFLDAGGMIELRVVSNKVRFDVSLAAARSSGLHLSAQLLRLASHVRGGSQ